MCVCVCKIFFFVVSGTEIRKYTKMNRSSKKFIFLGFFILKKINLLVDQFILKFIYIYIYIYIYICIIQPS